MNVDAIVFTAGELQPNCEEVKGITVGQTTTQQLTPPEALRLPSYQRGNEIARS